MKRIVVAPVNQCCCTAWVVSVCCPSCVTDQNGPKAFSATPDTGEVRETREARATRGERVARGESAERGERNAGERETRETARDC